MSDNSVFEQPTRRLMSAIQEKDAGSEYVYEATQEILKRWRQGIDLDALLDILFSENSATRLRGAYYLTELGREVEGLNVAAIQLSDDALSGCRKAFVEYVVSSGYYDENAAEALSKCLSDLDLYVRAAVIKWAISISNERFEDFSRLVEAGTGRPGRSFRNPLSNDFWIESRRRRENRALNIIRRIRGGEEIKQIREDISEEDSFTYDSFEFSKTHRERLAKWQGKTRR